MADMLCCKIVPYSNERRDGKKDYSNSVMLVVPIPARNEAKLMPTDEIGSFGSRVGEMQN